MYLKGCEQSFLKCRLFIKLDRCFLNEYYDGTIFAAIGSDPNNQMLLEQ
jgi:hypothetical protein